MAVRVLTDEELLKLGEELFEDLMIVEVLPDDRGEAGDYVKLKQRLATYKFELEKVIGDGNCYYRSFSYHCFQTQDFHHFIRAVTAAYMRAHPEIYKKEFLKMDVAGLGTNEQYCDYPGTLGNNAQEIHIKASCDAFSVKLVRLYSYGQKCIEEITPTCGHFRKEIFVCHINNHADAMFIQGTMPPSPLDKKRLLEMKRKGRFTLEEFLGRNRCFDD